MTPVLARPRLKSLGRFAQGSLGALILLVFALLLVYPLASFLALAFVPHLFGQSVEGVSAPPFRQAMSGYALRGLLNSLLLGLWVGAIATLLGAYLSWLTERTRHPLAGLIRGGMWALFLIPSYLLAIGWLILAERGGLLSGLGWDPAWLRHFIVGFGGVVLVLSVKMLPFAYLAIAPSWHGIGGELGEAARVHGLSPARTAWLEARLLWPALAAAFAVTFAEALSDFGVAATLGATANLPLATYTIYQALYSAPLNFPLAAASSWLLLLLTSLAVGLQAWVSARAARYAVLSGRSRSNRRLSLRGWARGLAWAVLALLALVGLFIPGLATLSTSLVRVIGQGLNWSNLTLANYAEALSQRGLLGPLAYSAELALLSATATLVLAVFLIGILRRSSRLARWLDLVLLSTLALPGLVLAAGYIFAYNLPFAPLYGTSILLAMAYTAGALPSASRILLGPFVQIQRGLSEAARVHGLSSGKTAWRIVLPLLAQPLLYAWLLAASGILFELPASELLYPPGHPPLAVALVKFVHDFNFGLSTALELLTASLVFLVVLLLRVLASRWLPRGWVRWRQM